MSTLFDSYRRRLSISGDVQDARAKVIAIGKSQFEQYAPQSPAFNHVLIDEKPVDLLIVSREVPTEKTIRTMPGFDFQVGQIVVWKGSHWLITQRDEDDAVTVRGKIEQCNRQLVWQNPETKQIISRWCTAEKPYYSNLTSDKYMVQSTREFKVQLPYDDETKLIDLGKRFMMEIINGSPKVYKVSSVDHTTQRFDRSVGVTGFLLLNITQDLYNPETDNAELEICDYIAPDSEPPEIPDIPSGIPKSKFVFRGEPTLRYGGSPKKIIYEIEGVDDYTNLQIEWYLKTDMACEDMIHLTSVSNEARVQAEDYAELEGLKIEVFAQEKTTKAQNSIALEVIG